MDVIYVTYVSVRHVRLVREGISLDKVKLPDKDPDVGIRHWLRQKGFEFHDGDGSIRRDGQPHRKTALILEIERHDGKWEKLMNLTFK